MDDNSNDKVCRTCLCMNDEVKISLFKNIQLQSSGRMELSNMITELTEIKYYPDARLPEVVCRTCVSDICRAYFFRRNCIKSEQALRKELNINEDFEQVKEIKVDFLDNDEEFVEEYIDPDTYKSNFEDQFLDNDEDNIEEDIIEEDENSIWKGQVIDFKLENINIKDEPMFESIDGSSKAVNDLPDDVPETELNMSDMAEDMEDGNENENASLIYLLKGETDKDFIYRCQFCERKYTCFSNLGKHRRKAHQEFSEEFKRKIDYFNDYLQSQGVDKYSVNRDGSESASNVPAIFKCQYCDDKFVTMFHLKRHTRVNHSDKVGRNCQKVLCDICGKAVLSKTLDLHKYTHSTERPFPCDICGKRFKAEIYLKDHHKRHTETISFFCEICNKGFTRKKGLVSHIKTIHCNSMPKFDCHLCDKKLSSKKNLANHLMVHNGDNPYREIEKNRPKRIRTKNNNKSKTNPTRGLQIQIVTETDPEFEDCEIETIEYDPDMSEF